MTGQFTVKVLSNNSAGPLLFERRGVHDFFALDEIFRVVILFTVSIVPGYHLEMISPVTQHRILKRNKCLNFTSTYNNFDRQSIARHDHGSQRALNKAYVNTD